MNIYNSIVCYSCRRIPQQKYMRFKCKYHSILLCEKCILLEECPFCNESLTSNLDMSLIVFTLKHKNCSMQHVERICKFPHLETFFNFSLFQICVLDNKFDLIKRVFQEMIYRVKKNYPKLIIPAFYSVVGCLDAMIFIIEQSLFYTRLIFGTYDRVKLIEEIKTCREKYANKTPRLKKTN